MELSLSPCQLSAICHSLVLELYKQGGQQNHAIRPKHFPCQLSGGQQQRVAIARAVIPSPKIILADEPTGNLDSRNGREVMDLLAELHREGTTIIMVTHSQHDANYADRIVNLFDGEVVSQVEM